MAVFTIAAGQTLRMDKMVGNGSAATGQLIGLHNGQVEWRWTNFQTDPESIIYQVRSTGAVFTPPFSDPETDASFVTYPLGNITLDMQFFDPAFGPGPVGTLTGTTWLDVTLIEYIQYVNIGGLDPLQPVVWNYELSFEGAVLFGGDDVVTLGDGDDVFNDPGGALQASLGAGDDIANLYEAGQGVTDEKFVDAGAGNDAVYYQSGNGTILGGDGRDTIGGNGNNDGVWLMNGGRGSDRVEATAGSRIEDDRRSGDDTYQGSFADDPTVVSYARGRGGISLFLPIGEVTSSDQGTDRLFGIRAIEGSGGADSMVGTAFSGFGPSFGVQFWGLAGSDTLTGGDAGDLLDGGRDADVLDGQFGDDTLAGGAGNDTLTGGAGADRMDGGADADTFVYLATGESTEARAGRDLIRGFDLSDVFDLSAIDADATTAEHEAFVFVGQSAFTYRGQIRYEHIGGNTVIFVHNSGGTNPEMRIDIAGLFDLTDANFTDLL